MLAPARTHKYWEDCPIAWALQEREARTPDFAFSSLHRDTHQLVFLSAPIAMGTAPDV
jgi:hypothetical protein